MQETFLRGNRDDDSSIRQQDRLTKLLVPVPQCESLALESRKRELRTLEISQHLLRIGAVRSRCRLSDHARRHPGLPIERIHASMKHRQEPIFLNVRRVLDMPQALGLAFPRSIRLYVKDDTEARAWTWPLELQKRLGKEFVKIRKVGD